MGQSLTRTRKGSVGKGTASRVETRVRLARGGVRGPEGPVIGLESEFTLFLQDEARKPEHVFRNPTRIVRKRMIPRTGRSYHLPSGGALYFDTGVIEVATPIFEVESGCTLRASRSLWDQIDFVRGELNVWEAAHRATVRLQGFSSHYNVSVLPGMDAIATRRAAHALAYILPVPTMLFAANRLSTGIGIRPREQRLEVTADFTPDPELMTAAVSVAVGIAIGVMKWGRWSVREVQARGIPVIRSYRPRKHTSRKGWLGRFDCFPSNPFMTDPNDATWELREGGQKSIRAIATSIIEQFAGEIAAIARPDTMEHIRAVCAGRARSLLDFPERPPRYDDVGRIIDWTRRSERSLPRGKYERVIHRVLEHRPIRIGPDFYQPERMLGWYEIAFRNIRSGRRRVFTLGELAAHLG